MKNERIFLSINDLDLDNIEGVEEYFDIFREILDLSKGKINSFTNNQGLKCFAYSEKDFRDKFAEIIDFGYDSWVGITNEKYFESLALKYLENIVYGTYVPRYKTNTMEHTNPPQYMKALLAPTPTLLNKGK